MANRALTVRCGVVAFLLTASPVALAQSAPLPVADKDAAPSADPQSDQDIVVTGRAGVGERTKLDTSYAITTLNNDALRSRAASSVTETLKSLPGAWGGAAGGERPGARLRTRQAKHLMACSEKFLDDGRADKAGGTGDENTHHDFPFAERVLAALAARRDQVNG